ncbi:MAG: thiopurine S-methyltransferase [Methylobacter sp.]
MQHEFWHQRWQQNQIGFHSDEINRHLQQQWPKLGIEPNSRVFVPMCGKSNDMLWLLAQGYQVVGVELSPLAVEAFFSDNGLQPAQRQQGNFVISESDRVQILCGDFFALRTAELGKIDAVYDRASLVALPQDMRIDYASHLSALLTPGAKMLLVAFDYPQHEMPGPPFSVQAEEVDRLYRGWCDIELLANDDVLEQELHLKERGLSQLHEQVYRLTVRQAGNP